MTPITYLDAREAIRWGNAKATHRRPIGIAYLKGVGWRLYDLTGGRPAQGEPEFLCFGLGTLPLPLSPAAKTIVEQMLTCARKQGYAK
jgi:hypothetical protein